MPRGITQEELTSKIDKWILLTASDNTCNAQITNSRKLVEDISGAYRYIGCKTIMLRIKDAIEILGDLNDPRIYKSRSQPD